MSKEDILVGQAVIQHQQVLDAITEMTQAMKKFGREGDTTLQGIAKQFDPLLKSFRGMASAAKSAEIASVRMGKGTTNELLKLRSMVKKANADIKSVADSMQNLSVVETVDPITGKAAASSREYLDQLVKIRNILQLINKLHEVSAQLIRRNDEEAKQQGATFRGLAGNIKEALEAEMEPGKLFGAGLGDLEKDVKEQVGRATKELKRLEDLDIDMAKVFNLEGAKIRLADLRRVATGLFEGAEGPAKEFGQRLIRDIDRINANFEKSGRNTNAFIKNVNALNSKFNKTLQLSQGIKEEVKKIKAPLQEAADIPPIIDEKKLATRKVRAELKQLTGVVKRLMDSASAEAKEAGADFQTMGGQMFKAFVRGDASAEETLKTMRELRTTANATGRAFVNNWSRTERSTNRATVSIWKLGNAMDRVGVRGAGGALRIVDAFRTLGPVAIGAALVIGGITIAVVKLTQAVIKLGIEAGKAFLKFTKEAVDVSKGMETLDRQLISILGHSEMLGKQLRGFLLEKSFQFGADLTEDFARLLVPLTKSTAQIEEFAEAMSAISASLPGIDFDRMVTLITQMASGQFRGARLTLRMTGAEIEAIKAAQEEVGNLQGVLIGLQDYMDRRGIDFSNIEDSLVIAENRMKIFRKEINLVFGEPIRDELGEQLNRLAQFVDDHRDDILDFFDFLGKSVRGVVEELGEFTLEFLEGFDDEDIRELKISVGELAGSIRDLIDALETSVQANDLITVLTTINTLIGNVTGNTAELINFIESEGFTGGIGKFLTLKTIQVVSADLGKIEGLGFTAYPGTSSRCRSSYQCYLVLDLQPYDYSPEGYLILFYRR